MIIIIPDLLHSVLCPRAQEIEIQNVWIKVEEVRQKPGYEIMYFNVKDCVDWIKYEVKDKDRRILVNYTTSEEPISYSTNAEWIEESTKGPMHLTEPGTYYFRVFGDRVEVLR